MRSAIAISPGVGATLTERLAANRVQTETVCRRYLEARQFALCVREEQRRLIEQARQELVGVRDGLAIAQSLRPPSQRRLPTAMPRVRPAPDALDERRRVLHEEYAAHGNGAIRAELMESYDGFARSLALKYRHRESLDDLIQVARIGLLHAIDRFDPSLGRPFPLFARITITGELKRHMRDKTWAMRVPRSLQEDYLNVMRAVDELTAECSDSPRMEALAERCGMSVERVVEAMELRVSQRAFSIDAPTTSGSEDPVFELRQDDTGFDRLESRLLLDHLLARLPERDRRIVELRFVGEMTQSEIAAEIGVSQMCVSRVLARTLGRLRLWARNALD